MLAKAGTFAKSDSTLVPVSQAVTGIGFQPKALILWTAGGTTANTWRANPVASIGIMTSATDEWAVGASMGPDTGAVTQSTTAFTSKALAIVGVNDATIAECDLTSMDADGFTLSWTTNDAYAQAVHYLALGGPDLTNAKTVRWQAPATATAKAVTGVGFVPDLVVTISYGRNGDPPAISGMTDGDCILLSAMTSAGQWVCSFNDVDGGINSDTSRGQLNDAMVFTYNSSLVTEDRAAFTSMDADGFTVTYSAVNTLGHEMASLCLKGGQYKVGSFNKDTGAQPVDQTVSGIGFQPAAVMLASFQTTTQTAAVAQGHFGLGAASGVGAEGAMALTSVDAQATQNADGLDVNDKAFVKVNNGTQTVEAAADFKATTSNSFTLTWATNDAVATEMVYIAFGPLGGGGGGGKGRGGGNSPPKPGKNPPGQKLRGVFRSWKWVAGWK